MNAESIARPDPTAYRLRFSSLLGDAAARMFPCDAHGRVDLDALSERARNEYFYARTVIGREFRAPAVLPND